MIRKLPHLRWGIVAMIFFASVLNYVDRQTLSILAPTIQRDLKLSNEDYASVLNFFLIAYTVASLLSGRVVDKLGVRVSLALFVGWWSVSNILTGFARSVTSLGLFRFLLGLGEAGNWTAAPKAVADWFPAKERGLAIGIYTLGATVGATIAPILIVALASWHSWQAAFVVTGVAGLVWLIPWLWLYRRPEEHSRITDAERTMLAESRAEELAAAANASAGDAAGWGKWWQLFARREVWLLIFGRMLTDPVWYFFQFWFAKYLYDQRGLDQKQLTVTWVVYFAADIGVLGGGWLSGLLIKRKMLPARSRLWVMLGCALIVPVAAAIPLFSSLGIVLAIGMLAVLAHMAWLINLSALVVDLVPKASLGFTFGVVATGSSLGGLMMNKAVGALVTNLSYDPAFYFMLLLHPLAWILLWQLRPRTAVPAAHPVSIEMHVAPPVSQRPVHALRLEADLVIVGGGLSGTCCAITAARGGIKVILVQDRPVLGGNASSEVRLWILGATSHMGNNNRWAREGGVIDELLVENTFRNPEGNPLLVDALLLEKVAAEPNITLLLNTVVHDITKSSEDRVESVQAFCSQNSTRYELRAPLFCDASGDGIVAFMAGAAFRMGAESSEEFGEKFAPRNGYGELLGHSMYFYSKDTGRPVQFTPPAFALKDITKIPRWRQFNAKEHGCKLWWIEHGGRLDTVHDTETIKWELWSVIYGVWHHIKNSGQFPEAANLTLEWVGAIPGKRESRRFEGDYLLRQQDIVEQRQHPDAVSFGGWAIDLHPGDGVFSEKPGCTQWHAKGVYQIPYRCLYSRNVSNLFLAGRIISATHVAFASSRVMATCAHIGQAVGCAAVLCRRDEVQPRALAEAGRVEELQRALLRTGQHIPGVALRDPLDLAARASITASSELRLAGFEPDGPLLPLKNGVAMMLPVRAGTPVGATLWVDVTAGAELRIELRQSSRADNHTPDITLATKTVSLAVGTAQQVAIDFEHVFSDERYAFLCLFGSEAIHVRCTEQRLTGVLSVTHQVNLAVAKSAVQTPPADIGVDTFEFWQPQRRPAGHNLAVRLHTPLAAFAARNVINGIARPTNQPNAWVADWKDSQPALKLFWEQPQTVARIELMFDPDYDHPMESVLMGHPERRMPFCVERYRITDDTGRVIAECTDNRHGRNVIVLPQPIRTSALRIELTAPSPRVPAALFEVRCYATAKM